MKLDKIKFARLIAYVQQICDEDLNDFNIQEMDNIIDSEVPMPEQQAVYPRNENVERLMMLMVEGTRKIEAIKEHRAITGFGLKESKDAVERYWYSKYSKGELLQHLEKQPIQQLERSIVLKFIESL